MEQWLNDVAGPWLDAWAQALLRACWQGGLAVLLAWLVCRMLAGLPARMKCWLWRLAYLKFLLCMLWAAPLRLAWLPARPGPSADQTTVREAVEPPGAASGAALLPPPSPSRPASEKSASAFASDLGQAVSPRRPFPLWRGVELLCFAVWCSGVTVAGFRLARGWRQVARLRAEATPVCDAALSAEMENLTRRLRLRRLPALLASDAAAAPLLCGPYRPAVVFPADLLGPGPTPPDVRLMLAHELAHLRRRDLLWNWLPAAVHTVLFFHPLLWLARREWRLTQEVACDEAAVAAAGARVADYGHMLLDFVRGRGAGFAAANPAVLALGVLESDRHQSLNRRLSAMKHFHTWSRSRRLAAGALVAAAALAVAPWKIVARAAGPDTPPPGEHAGAAAPADSGHANAGATVRAPGTIIARTIDVKVQADGIVQSLPVKEGQTVKAGELVCQLDDRTPRIELEANEAQLKLKEVILKRAEDLYAELLKTGKTNTELEQAKADVQIARIQVRYTTSQLQPLRSTAPFDGVVSKCDTHAGDVVTRGTTVCTLIEAAAPKVALQVPASDGARVRAGTKVRVRVMALDNRTYDGEVFFVSPQVDPATGTVEVKATIAHPDSELKPGMAADVTVGLEPPAHKE